MCIRDRLQTPKILASPLDSAIAAGNEIAQENWANYNTKTDANANELAAGTSYQLCRGADALRGATIIGLTRNTAGADLSGNNNSRWRGANEGAAAHKDVIAGLNKSEGQIATFDGGAKQSNDSDIQGRANNKPSGKLTAAHFNAKGGAAKGNTSVRLLRAVGGSSN